jgi:large subunit ribosomal protein L31
MKTDIHPKYFMEATVTCACGIPGRPARQGKKSAWKSAPIVTRSSGEQARIVDIEGQVDRFYKKLPGSPGLRGRKKARETERVSPERPVADLDLGKRPTDALAKAGIKSRPVHEQARRGRRGRTGDHWLRPEVPDRRQRKKLRALGYEFAETEKAV